MKRLRAIFFTAAVSTFAVASFANAASAEYQDYVVVFGNPIKSGNAVCLLQSVIDQLLPFAAVVLALILIIKGFQFVAASASANPGKIKEVRDAIFKILIYGAIVLAAVTILKAAFKFAQELDPSLSFPATCK